MLGAVFKIFGAAVVLGFALLTIMGYRSFLNKRSEERESFRRMLSAFRDGVDCFLLPIGKILEGMKADVGAIAELRRLIKNGDTPASAFDKIRDKLYMGNEGKEILKGFFSELGRGYKNGVVTLCESAQRRFDESCNKSDGDDEKNAKLYATLIIGGALGIVILFI